MEPVERLRVFVSVDLTKARVSQILLNRTGIPTFGGTRSGGMWRKYNATKRNLLPVHRMDLNGRRCWSGKYIIIMKKGGPSPSNSPGNAFHDDHSGRMQC